MPERIQLKRTKGWRKPENTVVVSRPGKWSNPWQILELKGYWNVAKHYRKGTMIGCSVKTCSSLIEAHTFAVEQFEKSLTAWDRSEIQAKLKGMNLACWCPLTDEYGTRVPCHADVLLRIANE